MNQQTVLFLCTNNSARSQMAEGLLNTLFKEKYKAFSAGINPKKVNSYAIEVMKELGIDISNHTSKSIEEFRNMTFDFVVTVCDNAKEICPFFPGKKVLHKSFEGEGAFYGPKIDIKLRDALKFFSDCHLLCILGNYQHSYEPLFI